MKARNKNTGEIVEYYITNHYKTDEEFYFTKQDSAMNYGEFNELYEVIPQTDKGINDDTSKKDDILDDPNHPYVGGEVLDNVPVETWEDRFNTEFVDEDTGLLNISKYDHERIINFFNNEIK
jgi:hypothetical protein